MVTIAGQARVQRNMDLERQNLDLRARLDKLYRAVKKMSDPQSADWHLYIKCAMDEERAHREREAGDG